MIAAGATYNVLILIPILLTIAYLMKKGKNSWLIGIIIGITLLIKQTIGLYFAIGIALYYIVEKQRLIEWIKLGLSSMLVLSLFLIELLITNNLSSFISMSFLGIKEFGTYNTFIDITSISFITISIVSIILSIIILTTKKVKILEENKKNIKIMFCIGLPLVFAMYPIFNYAHMIVSITVLLINFIYILETIFIEEVLENVNQKYINIINTFIVCLILIYVLFIAVLIFSNYKIIYEKDNIYNGTIITEDAIKELNNIDQFIIDNKRKNIDVKILSYQANFYMLPLNINNKNFDLPLVGNLGKDGENGLIKQIEKLNNVKILLIQNEEDMFWQESKKVRQYVKDNLVKEGSIEYFDIYSK